MRNRIVNLFAVAIVALFIGTTQAQAGTSLADMVFSGSTTNNGQPVYVNEKTPIFFEDEFGTSFATDAEQNVYILGVVDIQAIKAGQNAIGDDLGGGVTAGIVNIAKKGVPTASVQGNGNSLTALVFGQVVENEDGSFSLVPVDGARTVTTTKGEVVNLSAFSTGALVQVYYEQATNNLELLSAFDDVDNVTDGNLIAEFGLTGSGDEFYDLLTVGGNIAGFELSLNLIGANNSGLKLGLNDLGTNLYGRELGVEANVASTGWDVLDDADFKIVVIPAPAALPAGLALVGLIAARRRRNA